MATKNLVEYVDELLSYVNQTIKENGGNKEYKIDIRDRERTLVVEGTTKTKKQYYATIILYYEEDGVTKLVWRGEYVFYNLTAKRNDYMWKERMCTMFMYECVGVFVAIVETKTEAVDFNLVTDARIEYVS